MKVLIVASYNSGHFAPFVLEQAAALQRIGVELRFFAVQGKGAIGYLRNLPALKAQIRSFQPDIIHAHYGLSGLLATLQTQVPVVITFHGSDLNDKRVLPFSRLAMRRAAWNIRVFGSPSNRPNDSILPCGINLPTGQETPPKGLLLPDKKHVLFAGAFTNPVKNYPLAKEVVSAFPDVQLIELKNFTRAEVYGLMQASDVLLLTSHSEGSPQVIKEAMACGLPIVATNVGDISERLHNLEGCFVARSFDPQELAELLRKALSYSSRTKGRDLIIEQGLTNDMIASQLLSIYKQVLHKS